MSFMSERDVPHGVNLVRISYRDLWLVWHVVLTSETNGQRAIRKIGRETGVDATTVKKAIDRVEAAMGSKILVVTRRRTAKLTPAGVLFVQKARPLLDAWASLTETLGDLRAAETD